MIRLFGATTTLRANNKMEHNRDPLVGGLNNFASTAFNKTLFVINNLNSIRQNP